MFRRLDKIYIVNKKGEKKYGKILEGIMGISGKMYYLCDFGTQVTKLPDHKLYKEGYLEAPKNDLA